MLPSPYPPRTTLTASSATIHPGINAAIKDNAGQDITANFQTMLYRVPPAPKNTSGLTDRQVMFMRAIDTCTEAEGIFLRSGCNHRNQVRGSLQAYTYHCLFWIPDRRNPRYGQRVSLPYAGECLDNEICIDGRAISDPSRSMGWEIAHCVQAEAYVRVASSSNTTELEEDLANVWLDAAVSDADQKTPLEAQSIRAQAGASALAGAKGSTRSESCHDCTDLKAGPLAAGDGLSGCGGAVGGYGGGGGGDFVADFVVGVEDGDGRFEGRGRTYRCYYFIGGGFGLEEDFGFSYPFHRAIGRLYLLSPLHVDVDMSKQIFTVDK